MIDVCSLSKYYSTFPALEDISFHIEKGSIVGLLGQNGAGKTTLMNLLTGCIAPSKGNILINDLNFNENSIQCKRQIGYLPEIPPLYNEMTVSEYLFFAAELKSVPRRIRKEHIEQIEESTGLNVVHSRLISQLSKGYRQRTGLAQALCGDPPILILDEPTNGLDPKQIVDMRNLIKKLSQSHTILMSSHMLNEVRQLCSRVLILDHGKLKSDFIIGKNTDAIHIYCRFSVSVQCFPDDFKSICKEVKILPDENSLDCCFADFFFSTVQSVSSPEKEIFFIASSHHIPILSMTREDRSLEQAFLEAISCPEEYQ